MSARQLSRVTRDLVTTQIQNNISAALTAIRNSINNGIVPSFPPEVYYTFFPKAFQKTPACFVVVHDFDFVKEKFNSNFINAIVNLSVGILVENRSQDLLVQMADIYSAALDQVLDQIVLEKSAPDPVKCVCLPKQLLFSDEFTRNPSEDPSGNFHKYVVMDLEVRHYEGY